MYSGESILIRTIWEADPKLWAAPSERIFASDPASHESATPIKHVNQKMQKNLFYPSGETFPIKRVRTKNEIVSTLVRLLTFGVGTESRLISAKNISMEFLDSFISSKI